MHPPPHHLMVRPHLSVTSLILTVTFLILSFWLVNIFLYIKLGKLSGEEKKKQVLRYVLSYLMAFLLIGARMLLFRERLMLPGIPGLSPRDFFPVISALIYNTVVMVALELIVLQQRKAQVELENAELRMNHILAQHQRLKDQLQPHFLFNSLNILKSLIKKHPKEAEEYLIRLSDFLRASVTAHNHHVVTLRQELKVSIDYLEMQKVRFKEALRYKIEIPEEVKEEKYLPILALQILSENAIKHNAFTVEEPLLLNIVFRAPDTLLVSNNKQAKLVHEASSGVGLLNLQERYQVLAGQHIQVQSTKEHFIVELPLLRKE